MRLNSVTVIKCPCSKKGCNRAGYSIAPERATQPKPPSKHLPGGAMSILPLRFYATVVSLLILQTFPAFSDDAMDLVRERYTNWIVGSQVSDSENPLVKRRCEEIVRQCQSARRGIEKFDFSLNANKPYNSVRAGEDSLEIYMIVAKWLPALAIGYAFPGSDEVKNPHHQNPEVSELAMQLFDRLHERGFREPMLMPWKASQAGTPAPGQAVVVDFHLRVSGYALAVFLFREELAKTNRIELCLATCREILRHDEKYGDPGALKLNADGYRLAIHFALPFALAANDRERLSLIQRQTERSMAIESDASDTLKPDGLGFHHRGAYLAGYSAFAAAQAAFAAWLFDGTEYQISEATLRNLTHYFSTLRFVSQKYDMHKSLAGRLGDRSVVEKVLIGYAYLADLDHQGRDKCRAMLARLADESFMESPRVGWVFKGYRNEVPPGPSTIGRFHEILASARDAGSEPDPVGNIAYNYGPLMVHRRENWMASVKGFSKYLWAFERSLTDDRLDERRENVPGFHDSSASLYIFSKGDPVNADDSGYFHKGWDWCRIPGTTATYFTGEELLERDILGRRFNRPFSGSAFAGGVTDGRNGVFSMEYFEQRLDGHKPHLAALKSVFFFDEMILCLTTGIRNGDGEHPIRTTLFQHHLRNTHYDFANHDDDHGVRFLDPAGNGYWLPPGKAPTLFSGEQISIDWKGVEQSIGNYSAAWIEHGNSPDNDTCEYVILVDSDREKLDKFSRAQRENENYRILQKEKYIQIVEFPGQRTLAYALARPYECFKQGPLVKTSKPLLAMVKQSEDPRKLTLNLCDPDLNWKEGIHFQFRGKSRPWNQPLLPPVKSTFEVTMRGSWKLNSKHKDVESRHSEKGDTILKIESFNARTLTIEMEEAK